MPYERRRPLPRPPPPWPPRLAATRSSAVGGGGGRWVGQRCSPGTGGGARDLGRPGGLLAPRWPCCAATAASASAAATLPLSFRFFGLAPSAAAAPALSALGAASGGAMASSFISTGSGATARPDHAWACCPTAAAAAAVSGLAAFLACLAAAAEAEPALAPAFAGAAADASPVGPAAALPLPPLLCGTSTPNALPTMGNAARTGRSRRGSHSAAQAVFALPKARCRPRSRSRSKDSLERWRVSSESCTRRRRSRSCAAYYGRGRPWPTRLKWTSTCVDVLPDPSRAPPPLTARPDRLFLARRRPLMPPRSSRTPR